MQATSMTQATCERRRQAEVGSMSGASPRFLEGCVTRVWVVSTHPSQPPLCWPVPAAITGCRWGHLLILQTRKQLRRGLVPGRTAGS